MAEGLTSASGLLALLSEREDKLKEYALRQLDKVVDVFWAEIASYITQIEVLNENESFPSRELAALVASKVYYHIGSFKSAMIYALAAGKLFDVNEDSYYTKTLVSKCIDEYVRQRTSGKEAAADDVPISGLEQIVNSVFDASFGSHESTLYAVGIAVESRRLDRIEEAVRRSAGREAELLDYIYRICMDVVLSRDFRLSVFRLLVRLYRELTIPEWGRIAEILIFLDDSKSVADIICTLIKSEESFLIAYQVAFDLCSNASQEFRLDVGKEVSQKLEAASEQSRIQEYYAEMLKQAEEKERRRAAGETMEVDTSSTSTPSEGEKKQEVSPDRINHMKTILSATTSTSLFLEFLHSNNHTDKLVLQNIRTTLDSRSSVVYSSIIICHGFMNAGTTSDSFLRDNFDWLSKATNWSKFTATASLGVIQKGHVKESLALLAPYLPQRDSGLGSPYSEGGALYALGLIHANHGEEITDYLKNALLSAGTNEIVQHGACLGLGVAAMATRNPDVFEHLKNVMYTDSAVAGEAAGLAMGLVMLGSASDRALEDMLSYAHETQHEKIIRGLAIGISMIMCNRQEEADTLIQTLLMDKDPILRYGGMYTIALAYCGTANDGAIRKLLHVAVSDVSNDVRRAAVMGLGFVLLGSPEQCPKLVSLLAESYNPHVRYGAAMAIGISCAGTGLKVAVDMLETLLTDQMDFVRQGALIALSMVLIQTSQVQEPRVEKVRKLFADTIADKHEEIMAKFGACFATGIINAGGRNCTITPRSATGHIDTVAVVGLAMFTQYWYWHPLAHFLCLSFTPTAIIGLNKDLKMPVFKFKSNAPPSRFAYPPKVKPPTAKAPVKLESAQLSVTKKAMLRQKQKEKEKEEKKAAAEGGSTPSSPAMDVDKKEEAEKMEVDKEGTEKEGDEKEKEKEKEPEADHQILQNPARVTWQQLQYISFDVDDRYKPVKLPISRLGIVVLRDSKPDQPEEFVTPMAPPSEREEEEDEPEPPQAFEFDPDKEKD